jgi:hypothetical protein
MAPVSARPSHTPLGVIVAGLDPGVLPPLNLSAGVGPWVGSGL